MTAAEIDQIIAEMGPVDGGAGAEERTDGGARTQRDETGREAGAPRRLYQIREGAMLSGVCNGLGAYFNIDPTIVRIIFILLAILTKGLWVFVYLVLMIVIPCAATPEERAAAHGWRFSAQDVIDRAKRQYAEFKESKAWKRQWRLMRRQWRHQWRGTSWHPPAWSGPASPLWRAGQAWMTATAPLFAIVNVALIVLLALVLVSLARTHALLGYPLPAGVPVWAAILIAIGVYSAIASPFHHIHRAAWYGAPSAAEAWLHAWINLVWLAFVAFSIWWGFHHIPQVHDFIEQVMAASKQAFNN